MPEGIAPKIFEPNLTIIVTIVSSQTAHFRPEITCSVWHVVSAGLKKRKKKRNQRKHNLLPVPFRTNAVFWGIGSFPPSETAKLKLTQIRIISGKWFHCWSFISDFVYTLALIPNLNKSSVVFRCITKLCTSCKHVYLLYHRNIGKLQTWEKDFKTKAPNVSLEQSSVKALLSPFFFLTIFPQLDCEENIFTYPNLNELNLT